MLRHLLKQDLGFWHNSQDRIEVAGGQHSPLFHAGPLQTALPGRKTQDRHKPYCIRTGVAVAPLVAAGRAPC